ncbi:hypothetical protein [Nocardia sp. NPDC049707]|uniref:hypothetical protein n=1 Tax=Nocardia sp. NPDC049707 TaxID=3154735 RepID=UPI0034268D00
MNNPINEADARKVEFYDRIARWADYLATTTLTDDQDQGWACVKCSHNQLTDPDPELGFYVAGFGPVSHVFVCGPCDPQATAQGAAVVGRALSPGDYVRSVLGDGQRRGVVSSVDAPDGYVRVRFDGIGLPVVCAPVDLELVAELDPVGAACETDTPDVSWSMKVAKAAAASVHVHWLSRHRSLDTLAASLGMTTRALKQRLTGKKPWNITDLVVLSCLLGVSVWVWLGLEETVEQGARG